MDDISHQHIADPVGGGSDIAVPEAVAPKPARPRDRPLMPKSITDKMVERPVTTAVIFILFGAFVAEGVALLVARGQARNALRRSAYRNLRLADELDPHRDPPR
jgi:hypothetical protein